MKLGSKIVLAAALCYTLLGSNVVLGAVIEDAFVFNQFDNIGTPIPGDVFPTSVDAVRVWINMTDVNANDTILFEWYPPSGNLYHSEEWIAPVWVESAPYSTFTEIEIMGE